MKTLRFLAAASLALVMLMGTLLAMAWWQPNVVSAEDATSAPVASQALPPPYLSDDDVADAPYHSRSPAVDGRIDPGEYAGAGKVAFPGYAGEVEVLFKQDATNLYIAFDSPDTTPFPFSSGGGVGPAFQVFLDTNNSKESLPQEGDYRLTVDKGGGLTGNRGNGTRWIGGGGIEAQIGTAVYTATWGWQAELVVPFSVLNITQTGPVSIGLGLAEVWTPSWPKDWYWPSGGYYLDPSSWGNLVSSSEWGTFYWKPGLWEDYAPSGLPDFDQQQVAPTYCGPFAAANSLWWFDSKFEQNPVGPPPGGPPSTIPLSDSYPLVQPYGPEDDHDPQNVASLALDLGTNYFGTDQGPFPGTHVYSMYHGIQNYLRDRDLWDEYVVTLVNQPEFDWIAEEVMRSEDVILLLGFWEEIAPGAWARIGGHFVTVAGVDLANSQIAFSDPAKDAAGAGWLPLSRVLSGTLIPHTPIPGHPFTTHNDAGNVSHDVYQVLPGSPSPGGIWWIPDYEAPPFLLEIPGLNPNPRWTEPPQPPMGGPIHTEIEYALAVSPFEWKASGRWIADEEVELYGRRFEPYEDFAPSGVPDFDQKQDGWGRDTWLGWQWSHCGPVAAANSLWWFDSKFEHHGALPPTISDTYPLVWPYGQWDDHDPDNVLPFVGELAFLADTDGLRTGNVHGGTVITDLYHAIITRTAELRQGYVITKVRQPEFYWVAEEVERSEDVILLLGFYADFGDFYERVGGHYVTVPGVDKSGFIAFSDPYWDRMGAVLPPNEFTQRPLWTGRVGSDGDLPLGPSGLVPAYTHTPLPHTGIYTLHNDAANVSHDVYRVVTTTSPGGTWGAELYIQDTAYITNFAEMNGPGSYVEPGYPVQTEVEWAIAVSPVADVWITKTVAPTAAAPGDWVTFTITFANMGNDAEDVVIYDALHPGLTDASYTYALNYPGALSHDGAYTWTVGTLRWQEGGTITVTAQVDPGMSWPFTTLITNTAEIATTTQEQYQIAQAANAAQATLTVNAGGYLAGSVYDYETGSVAPPCTAALVSIAPGGLTATVNSTTGAYGPVALIAGIYTATASASGYSTVAYTVSVANGMTTTQDFALQRPVVEVTPTDFISITAPANQSVTHSLAITNAGHAAMDFEIQEMPSDLTWVGVDPITGTIPGPGTADVDVTFLCTETKDYTGTLHVIHDDPCEITPITVPITLHCTQLCVEVTGVDLSLTTGGTIYTDTNVQFSANIAPDDTTKPYSYTIDYGDGVSTTASSSADPLAIDHTFASTGVHTVEIGVWNCAMTPAQAVTSSVVVTVSERPVSCVGITWVDYGWSPVSPQAGEVVTFTITSILPVTATPPFTYQWGFGDGGAATGNPVTHTYAISGSYWTSVTATNACGGPVWMSHPVNVTGEPAIAVSPLSLSAILNPGETAVATLTIGNASTATANLNWELAENPARSWLDELPTSGTLPPSGSDDVAVTFDATSQSPGVYTATLAVTSDDPDKPQIDVSAVMTVNCVPVTGVDLIVTDTGAIYTDTVVEFSADVAPDDATKPYSYTIDYGDGERVTATSSADPLALDHTFASTGAFTVEIGVWNCDMTEAQAITDTVEVTVSEQPTSCVAVNVVDVKSDSPVYLGDAMHFTATITGDVPIVYTWDLDSDGVPEQTGFGLETISHVYSSTGTYTVTLDAMNACPSTDTYSIQVMVHSPTCEPVTGIDLGRASAGTIYTDTAVPFNADIAPEDATKPYTYRLTIDGAPGGVMTSGDDPLVFTETFATTGTHTVEIAAWNCDMAEAQAVTDTITFTVYEPGVCVPLTNITIHGETSGAPGVYTFTTRYEPTDASEPIVYVWEDNSTAATSIRNLEAGTYNLRVTAANDCTDPAVTDTHTITVGQYIYLPLVMRGHS